MFRYTFAVVAVFVCFPVYGATLTPEEEQAAREEARRAVDGDRIPPKVVETVPTAPVREQCCSGDVTVNCNVACKSAPQRKVVKHPKRKKPPIKVAPKPVPVPKAECNATSSCRSEIVNPHTNAEAGSSATVDGNRTEAEAHASSRREELAYEEPRINLEIAPEPTAQPVYRPKRRGLDYGHLNLGVAGLVHGGGAFGAAGLAEWWNPNRNLGVTLDAGWLHIDNDVLTRAHVSSIDRLYGRVGVQFSLYRSDSFGLSLGPSWTVVGRFNPAKTTAKVLGLRGTLTYGAFFVGVEPGYNFVSDPGSGLGEGLGVQASGGILIPVF